jgi:hypothetical protein
VRDARFLRHFRAPGNIVMYDSKTKLSAWLEDYCLACRAAGVSNDLYIIQFLPIYLADYDRAWLDYLPRNVIDSWDGHRRIFTGNF